MIVSLFMFLINHTVLYLRNRRHWWLLRRMMNLFSWISWWHFHFGNGVEHVVEPVFLVVVKRYGPSVTLGDTAFGQKGWCNRVTPSPRFHARGHHLSVRHRKFQRGVESFPVGPPFQKTWSRRSGWWRARVTGQQFPLTYVFVAIVPVIGNISVFNKLSTFKKMLKKRRNWIYTPVWK